MLDNLKNEVSLFLESYKERIVENNTFKVHIEELNSIAIFGFYFHVSTENKNGLSGYSEVLFRIEIFCENDFRLNILTTKHDPIKFSVRSFDDFKIKMFEHEELIKTTLK